MVLYYSLRKPKKKGWDVKYLINLWKATFASTPIGFGILYFQIASSALSLSSSFPLFLGRGNWTICGIFPTSLPRHSLADSFLIFPAQRTIARDFVCVFYQPHLVETAKVVPVGYLSIKMWGLYILDFEIKGILSLGRNLIPEPFWLALDCL